jgi:hypothetical protein
LDKLRAAVSAGEAQAAAAAAKASAVVPADATSAKGTSAVPPETVRPIEVRPPEQEFVLEIEDEPPAVAKAEPKIPSAPVKPAAQPVVASTLHAKEPEQDILGDLVADLEQSLGDFVPGGAPQPHSEPAHTASAHSAPVSQPLVNSAAAQVAAGTNGGIYDPESTSVLSNILSDLRHDLGEDTVEAEDPETHYNLGIAFKEMGLLDEAIGELQKVCHAMEVGVSFSQPVQAYTWLAQCLVDKGVPEAAVRWYEKALQLPGLDHSSRCAIYYDLGSAYEASGDKKSALANFMEVYSSNIDFRDVASRIKVLKP